MRDIARLLGSALLAALAMIAWRCAIFCWSDLAYKSVAKVYDAGEVARFLQPRFPESGTYMVPGPHDDPELRQELRETGPAVTLQVLVKQDMLSIRQVLAWGFFQALLTALLLGWLLTFVRPGLPYRSRAMFVALGGFAAALSCDPTDVIWWYHPWPWSIVKAVHDCTAWIIAGLILAKLVKPKPDVWIPRDPPTVDTKTDLVRAGQETQPQS